MVGDEVFREFWDRYQIAQTERELDELIEFCIKIDTQYFNLLPLKAMFAQIWYRNSNILVKYAKNNYRVMEIIKELEGMSNSEICKLRKELIPLNKPLIRSVDWLKKSKEY